MFWKSSTIELYFSSKSLYLSSSNASEFLSLCSDDDIYEYHHSCNIFEIYLNFMNYHKILMGNVVSSEVRFKMIHWSLSIVFLKPKSMLFDLLTWFSEFTALLKVTFSHFVKIWLLVTKGPFTNDVATLNN